MAVELPRRAPMPSTDAALPFSEANHLALVAHALVARLALLTSTLRADPSLMLPRRATAAGAVVALLAAALILDGPIASAAQHLPLAAVHLAAQVTQLGQGWLSIVPAVLVALWFGWASFAPASRRERARSRLLAEKAMFVACALVVPSVLGTLLKHVVGRVRPPHIGLPNPFAFEPFSAAASRASFPSGHSLTVAALFVAIGAVAPRWRAPLAIVAVAVFASRLAVEAHYTSDVLAGAALGVFGAGLTLAAFRQARIGFRRGCSAGAASLRRPAV